MIPPPSDLGEAVRADRLHRHRMATDPEYREHKRRQAREELERQERRRAQEALDAMAEPAVGAMVRIAGEAPGLPEGYQHRTGTYMGRVRRQPSGAWIGAVHFLERGGVRNPTPAELRAQRLALQSRPEEPPPPLGLVERAPFMVRLEVPVRALEAVEPVARPTPSDSAESAMAANPEERSEESFFDGLADDGQG